MAKVSGLNVRCYVQGRDISGDANALDGMGYSQQTLDVTPLNTLAMKRITGRSDGSLSINCYFDAGTNLSHSTFTSNSGKLPTANQIVTAPLGSAVGSDFAGLIAKEADYNVTASTGSAITSNASFSGTAGVGGEFGEMLTAFDDTHSSATDGTAIDNSASSASGGAGYAHFLSLGSGSVVVKIEHSSDNVTWADLITFSTIGTSDVPTAERSEVTGTVNRYVRVSSSGTFTNAVIAVGFARF